MPTFPYFSLSKLPSLVHDLGLTPASYLDTYIPDSSKWEQQQTSNVRLVETHQRLLYRKRKSLFEGLSEVECPGLSEELALQQQRKAIESPLTQPFYSPNKRPATELPEGAPPSKMLMSQQANTIRTTAPPQRDVTNTFVMRDNGLIQPPPGPPHASPIFASLSGPNQPGPIPGTLDNSAAPIPTSAFQSVTLSHQDTSSLSPSDGATATTPPNPITAVPNGSLDPLSSAPDGTRGHAPIKRWPNDYTVAEIADGFRRMDHLVSSTSSTGGPGITQKAAFEKIFGSRYVKSTVCRHRGVWRKASEEVKSQFEKMGNSEQACWGEFVRKVEGREMNRIIFHQQTSAGVANGATNAQITAHATAAAVAQMAQAAHSQQQQNQQVQQAQTQGLMQKNGSLLSISSMDPSRGMLGVPTYDGSPFMAPQATASAAPPTS